MEEQTTLEETEGVIEKISVTELFDDLAEKINMIREKRKDYQTALKACDKEENEILIELEEMHDKGVKGKMWTCDKKVKTRRIGKPADPELDALEEIHEGFVRKSPPSLQVYSPLNSEKHLAKIRAELVKQNLKVLSDPSSRRSETMAQIEKVMKDNPQLNRQRNEIMGLLDLQVKEELIILPSILNDITE